VRASSRTPSQINNKKQLFVVSEPRATFDGTALCRAECPALVEEKLQFGGGTQALEATFEAATRYVRRNRALRKLERCDQLFSETARSG